MTSGGPPELALVSAEVVGSESSAVTVRVRQGNTLLNAGSPTEVGQCQPEYLVIEAKDLNDAIRVASKLPTARTGSVELRPIGGE